MEDDILDKGEIQSQLRFILEVSFDVCKTRRSENYGNKSVGIRSLLKQELLV